jgi:3-hydroxybutyryl-CoA dehydratase
MPVYLEDLREGAEYRSAARLITEGDITAFAELSGDFSPLHTDDAWVRENTPFSGRIAHGALVFAVSQGLRTPVVDDIAVIAFLEFERTLAGPVYPGDVIRACWTVAEVRRSRSRPDRGVARLRVDVVNQDGTVVQRGRDTYLAAARPPLGAEPGARPAGRPLPETAAPHQAAPRGAAPR